MLISFLQREWGSVLGIATRYGLDGLGFEPGWGRHYLQTSRLDPWSTQSPVR